MDTGIDLHTQWQQLRERLRARQLLDGPRASLSLRIPGSDAMWWAQAGDEAPQRLSWREPLPPEADAHAAVYRSRGDAGAVAIGGGAYGRCLAHFGGGLPQVFDEQARHIGPMAAWGNVLLLQGRPACLGMTATRLALNAELFEKCAKAYVLAVAAGGRVKLLPWLVRAIANRRLRKDQQRAAERFMQGQLPEESRGY
jgi:hypothetical protein